MCCFFFECYGAHRALPVLTNSIPTRRSSDRVIELPRHTLISQFLAEGAVFLAIARIAHDVGGAALHVRAAVQIGAPIAGDGRQRAWPDLPVDLGRDRKSTRLNSSH